MTPAIVREHLAAVRRGDIAGMAVGYDVNAVIVRGDDRYRGREAIATYFATVPARLDGHVVDFDEPTTTVDGSIEVRWRIDGLGISGTDRFVVRDGWIVEQVVDLDGGDF